MFKNKQQYIILFILLISIISSIPFLFFNEIYVQGDYVFHLSRMEAYTNSVRNLSFFPKIFYDYANNAGYATDLFYPSIFLLPYSFFRIIGLSVVRSYALYNFLINLLTASTSYLLGYTLFKKRKSALLLSILYTLSTYRFFDQIARGAIGELLGYAFLPLAVIGLYAIFFNEKRQWLLTVGMSLIILSHMLTAYMLFFSILILIIYAFITRKKTRINLFIILKKLIYSGICTFLLTAWQLIPIFEQSIHFEYNYSNTGMGTTPFDVNAFRVSVLLQNFEDLFKNFFNILSLGSFLYLLLIIITIFYFKLNFFAKSGIILSWLFILLSSSRYFIWDYLKDSPIKFIQFPFRWLTFATLIVSMLIVYVFYKYFKNNKYIFIVLSIVQLFIILKINFSFVPVFVANEEINNIFLNNTSFGGGQEYVKKGERFDTILPKNNREIEIANPSYIKDLKVSRVNNILEIRGNSEFNTVIKTPFTYYYGYQANINNKKSVPCIEKNGRVAIVFPKGTNTVKIQYKKTKIQVISMCISLFSTLLFVIMFVMKKFRVRQRK